MNTKIDTPQVFAREMQPGKFYTYLAYADGSDGWYVGPFDSEESAVAYQPIDDQDAIPVRVTTVDKDGSEVEIKEL